MWNEARRNVIGQRACTAFRRAARRQQITGGAQAIKRLGDSRRKRKKLRWASELAGGSRLWPWVRMTSLVGAANCNPRTTREGCAETSVRA